MTTKVELYKQARRFGRSERWVDRAIEQKLIWGGRGRGIGRGRGKKFTYPPEALSALRSVHRLRSIHGYRRNALNFAAWWIWDVDLTIEAREYVADILGKSKARLERAVLKDAGNRSSKEGIKEFQSIEDKKFATGDWLDNHGNLSKESLEVFDFLSMLFPDAAPELHVLQQAFYVVVARAVGFDPKKIGASVAFLEESIRDLGLTYPKRQIAMAILVLQYLETHDWYNELIKLAQTASPQDYAGAREFLRTDIVARRVLRSLVSREKRIQDTQKKWERLRAGVWRKPGAAYRAGLLILLLGLMKWTGEDDLFKLFAWS